MTVYKKLRGFVGSIFQLGLTGPQLKPISGGVLEIRDDTDAAYAITRGLDPVGAQDYVTKTYFETNNAAANGLTIVEMPLALATKVSTAAIPDNATIHWAQIDVTTAYDTASPTFKVTRTGDATAVALDSTDSNLKKISIYDVPQRTDWGSTGAGTVTATLVGAPTVGAAMLVIAYSTPTDIS